MRRTFIFAFCLPCLILLETATPAPAQRVGDVVVAIAVAPIRQGKKIVDKTLPGDTFSIENVQGNLIHVTNRASGWMSVKAVLPPRQAAAYFTKLLQRNPRAAEGYVARGNAWTVADEPKKAIEDYTRSIRLKARNSEAFLNRGMSWMGLDKVDKAIADFDQAARLDPKYAKVFLERGSAWNFKEEYKKAIADLNRAIRLDAKLAEAYYERGMAWGDLDNDVKALADFNKAIRLDSHDAWYYVERGRIWEKQKKLDRADADFKKAIEIDPEFSNAHGSLADLLQGQKEFKKALTHLDKAIEIAPDHDYYYKRRGDAHRRLGNDAKAVADYRQALKLDENYEAALYRLANLLSASAQAKVRNGKQAVAAAQKLCKLTKFKNDFYLSALAAAHAESGDFAKAVSWQNKGIKAAGERDTKWMKYRLKLYEQRKPHHEKKP